MNFRIQTSSWSGQSRLQHVKQRILVRVEPMAAHVGDERRGANIYNQVMTFRKQFVILSENSISLRSVTSRSSPGVSSKRLPEGSRSSETALPWSVKLLPQGRNSGFPELLPITVSSKYMQNTCKYETDRYPIISKIRKISRKDLKLAHVLHIRTLTHAFLVKKDQRNSASHCHKWRLLLPGDDAGLYSKP